jgi:GSH-dependent disulfide-bond oxidoreductase
MLKFYFNGSPNPSKIALFLEEAGLPYEPIPVDVRKGEQFRPELLALNPNAKVPVLVDGDVTIFDSNAILLYLAERTGKFMPANDPKSRAELLSWLMFVATGIGPYMGQAVHFRNFAPKGNDYAHERYQYEARRHFGVLNDRLQTRPFLLGDAYTIIDMSVWGWARVIPFAMGDEAWLAWPQLRRWFDGISARPAALRAAQLKDRFTFKTDMDDDARRNMFKHMKLA